MMTSDAARHQHTVLVQWQSRCACFRLCVVPFERFREPHNRASASLIAYPALDQLDLIRVSSASAATAARALGSLALRRVPIVGASAAPAMSERYICSE